MATASRYLSGAAQTAMDNRTGMESSGTTTGNTSSTGTQTTNSSTSSSQTQDSYSKTNNMSAASQAALERLIAQLTAGGTPEMKAQQAQRQGILNDTRTTQSGYTKENAFADAQGAMAQQMRRALESMLPAISRAAEDAGSSGGALRALLLQDAADKAAQSSAALGVQTATNYGNINANFAQVLEQLTRSDPAATQALLSALNVAKGAETTTRGSVTTSGFSNTNSTTQTAQNSNSSQSSNENKTAYTDYKPFAVDTTPQFFGVMDQPSGYDGRFIGTTRDTLAQLAGTGDPWNSYTF